MSPENTHVLHHDFPRLYAELDSFECGDEYFDRIYKLSYKLCQLAEQKDYEPEDLCFDEGDGIYPRITQVKVKYGELRIYAHALAKGMQKHIDAIAV